jgi:hypothetical protein
MGMEQVALIEASIVRRKVSLTIPLHRNVLYIQESSESYNMKLSRFCYVPTHPQD